MQIVNFLSFLVFISLLSPNIVLGKTSVDKCDLPSCAFDRAKSPPLENVRLQFERVVDGDTFVASGRKIRVWGIDTPERNEIGYQVAGWFLESLIKDRQLSCKLIAKDKYQRDVMQCYCDGVDIGSEMVRFGLARDYKKYSGGFYQREQEAAKKGKRGLWSIKK